MIKCVTDFSGIAQPNHGERYSLALVPQGSHFFIDFIDRVVVAGNEKNCTFIEECRYDGVHNGVRLTCSRRPLNVGQRVFHGIVDCQKLVEIHFPVQKCYWILFAPDRTLNELPKKRMYRGSDLVLVIHLHDSGILVIKVQRKIKAQCKVTVKNPTLTVPKSLTVKKGKKATIKVKSVPKGKVTFKSSDKKIATVSAKGVVKGKKKGSCKITVTVNGMKKTLSVKVKG